MHVLSCVIECIPVCMCDLLLMMHPALCSATGTEDDTAEDGEGSAMHDDSGVCLTL
jgi:hypothetical protein